MFAPTRGPRIEPGHAEREVIPDFGTARWKKFAPNETGRRRKMTKTRREIDAAMNAKITLVCVAPTVRYWLSDPSTTLTE
jgi:hypothetical protein